MDEVRKHLNDGYALALAKWQIELYQARNQRDAKPIQRYFNSTPARNAMARLMFVASLDKSVYTKARIAKELIISRQAASVMVEECIEAGWVEPDGRGYKASPALVAQQYDYTQFHIQTVMNRPLRYWLNAMENYETATAKVTSDK